MTINYDKFYIGGGWAAPLGPDTIDVASATTEEHLGSAPTGAEKDIDAAVNAARHAFDDPAGWSTWEPSRRFEVLNRFAEELEARGSEMATRVTQQNGMPITISQMVEAGFPPKLLRFYGQMMVEAPREEIRAGMLGGSIVVRKDPIGVVAAIVPWNVPQTIAFLKVAPALAAGCTVVLKPSPETVLDAFLMAEAAVAAGLPAGILNVVPGGREVGAYLVEHPGVDKVSFTGSTLAGRTIGERCGRLFRPVTLELGGKSAGIVLDDADLESNVQNFVGATLFNNGQACWACTRILAPQKRYQEIVDTVTGLVSSLVVGDPLDAGTMVGPLVSPTQRDRVESYIAKGSAEGAKLTTGGGRPTDREKGWFVQPTVFADVDHNHTIAQEEIFGPVLSIISYRDEDEALRIANGTDYGLGGSVWTADPERGAMFARKVLTGTIGINGYMNDPAAPFGGIKSSGLGREMGPEGLTAYQTLKTIYLDADAPASA